MTSGGREGAARKNKGGGRRKVGRERGRGREQRGERKERGGNRGREGGTWRKEKKYIATCVNTYQLISSEFLSSLKHGPKVDCGREKTNKAISEYGNRSQLKHITSCTVHPAERERKRWTDKQTDR